MKSHLIVISGGQTGVDQAALRAAKYVGFQTGGWAPHGYRTLDGNNLDLTEKFGLKEHASSAYAPRTWQNVVDADATMRIASDFSSPGEICTMKAIRGQDSLYLDVDKNDPLSPNKVVQWIIVNNIYILNVAGNSEKTSPGIGLWAENYLIKVFSKVFRMREIQDKINELQKELKKLRLEVIISLSFD